ncbi:hypothetical protein [Senegalimassilia anaerobia]|uniref:hypothetical protein n=1 Tax=Senegalimassilia anaerobia TaxID=1473216 RepID=UPI0026EB2C57|nr:hypothetical protein [Senegalimassilia anaerobia]
MGDGRSVFAATLEFWTVLQENGPDFDMSLEFWAVFGMDFGRCPENNPRSAFAENWYRLRNRPDVLLRYELSAHGARRRLSPYPWDVKLGHLIGCPSGLLLRIRRLLFDGSVSLR